MPEEVVRATKESFRAELEGLVQNFAANEDEYTSSDYPEAQVRLDFLDPFFRALGWDIENRAGLPYGRRDVIVEKGAEEGNPDYTFRVGSLAKFFVEAKAPHEHLDSERHVLQVKRYAWSSKEIFAVILTDFEEFRFYDASQEPDPNHPHRGLLVDLTYKQYLANLDGLWEFSRGRVAAGSLEVLLPRDKRSLQFRKPPDEKFLEDMTRWREELARAVHKRSPDLSASDLTDVVQRLLDRLIFIRVAEDRRIVEKNTLLDRALDWEAIGGRKPLLPMLNDLFHQINEDFNGEIFKPHACEQTAVEEIVLHRIIKELYPPKSPYRFDAIPVDIFGAVYERYLGKTIYVKGKKVEVDDKPEVRKAGGVYYTPKYIVDYIVKHTVGKVIEGKSPKEIEKMRILDPACGSGSFLLGGFQCLIDYHVAWYEKHAKEARAHPLYPELVRDENGAPRLSIWRKAKILSHNLFGVDLDPQAVEITMMNLYLKALEGERDLPHKQHLLPELAGNIRCGNSLIGPDIAAQQPGLSKDELGRLRPFDWHAEFPDIMGPAEGPERSRGGGFDAVIGNPPYGDTLTPQGKDYLVRVGFEAGGGGNNDIFRFMVEKGLGLLHENRPLGMILPNSYLAGSKYRNFRTRIMNLAGVEEIVDFGIQKVFDVDVFSSILILSKLTDEKQRRKKVVRYLSDGLPPPTLLDTGRSISILQDRIADTPWIPSDPILEKLKSNPAFHRMGEVCEIKDAGINYQRVGVGWQKRAKSKLAARILYEGRRRDSRDHRYIKGEDIQRFLIKPIDQRWLRHDYKRFIGRNEVVAFGKEILEAPDKIVTRQTGDSIIAAIDRKQLYTGRSLHSWVLKQTENISVELVVDILNSKLLTYLYQAASRERGRALAQVKLNKLKDLPFPNLAKLDSSKRKLCDRIVETTNKLLNSSSAEGMRTLGAEVNKLVYDLYGLTAAERKLVENALPRHD